MFTHRARSVRITTAVGERHVLARNNRETSSMVKLYETPVVKQSRLVYCKVTSGGRLEVCTSGLS